ncbi:hypothetical protein P8452_18473 [Trifolium repens]|nr:hypothetical protein P8452_18473 [Trifolium repens]
MSQCVLMLLSMHNILGVHVNIVNTLEGNLDLTVHCKSADDDLGVHLLHHGDNYGFSFGTKIFGRTQFYCSFRWINELHYFDIYIESSVYSPDCDYCNWHITKAGPCYIQDSVQPAFYSWNKNKII